MLSNDRRSTLSESMRTCRFYRQYTRSGVYHEPRFHVLLSSGASSTTSTSTRSGGSESDAAEAAAGGGGYSYHGIRMRAMPIDIVPDVSAYASELASEYGLPYDRWGIGVDLIAYRDGEDGIGWHADDTQGESVVLCVVVDAPGEPRPVHVRPNVRAGGPLSDGDEEIQLYVGEGDGYDMDGTMQRGYEHRLPKRVGCCSHRFVLIFRHGDVGSVPVDSGVSVVELLAGCGGGDDDEVVAEDGDISTLFSRIRVKRPSVSFGHPQGVAEGSWYSRRHLYSTYAHRSDQRGVNGNIHFGADSIVVSRQSPDHREEDGLQWLRYTSNRRQDVVTSIWDATGHLMTKDNAKFPAGGIQYTFHLERLPERLSPTEFVNSLSLLELWEKIQLSHGRSPILPFVPPRPKHHGKLPELLNDAQQQTKYFNPKTNGMTSQRLFVDSYLFSSHNAMSESSLEKWTSHQYDARLDPAPYLTEYAWYGYHHTPSSLPFQGCSLGKQQGNYQTNNVHEHNTSSIMRDARRLTCHGTWTGINTNRHAPFPSMHPSVPQLGLFSEGSQLRPFLSEKAMIQTIGEMMPKVRDQCKQPEDLDDQYKKWEEKKLPVVVEFEQGCCNRPLLLPSRLQPDQMFQVWHADRKERWRQQQPKKWPPDKVEKEELQHRWEIADEVQDSPMLLLRHLQPEEVWLADRKERWRQQQQKKWPPDKVEKEEFQHRWEIADEVQDSPMLLLGHLQPERFWLADRKTKWRQWKKKSKDKNSVQLTGRAILALEAYVSDFSRLILGSATRSRKKTDLHPSAHKIASRAKQRVMGGLEAKKSRPSRKDKLARPQMTKPTKAIEQPLKIIPRFIIDKEKRTQTVSPLLQALYFVRRGKKSQVKVTVKWRISDERRRRSLCGFDSDLANVTNRNTNTDEPISGGTVNASRLCKSPKMLDKIVNARQSRCIRPRFILDDENRTESVSPHLEASYSVGKRKVSHVKVTVKLGIPGKCQEKQMDSGTDEPALSRKRKLDAVEVLFEATDSDTYRRRKSSRLLRFRVNEMIFAWDKGHLYEAKVLKWRDAKDGGMEYFVHYLGYGETHDRWLATFNMLKCTPSTREFYNDCASWPLNDV
ncbi:hypothetical protein ACHAW5_009421 [Stephanodiscus triporus]|uniref:Tudor-knot domain-containing protein n=1 Tax=Stephanodiscus triporus TaxID=2934178 RepID=A0ABD3PUU2_9STRA